MNIITSQPIIFNKNNNNIKRKILHLFIATYFFIPNLYAQPFSIKRTGHNEITIHSQSYTAFSIKIGKSFEGIIAPFQTSQPIRFSLSTYSVRNTPIIVSYDINCLKVDSLYALHVEQNQKKDVDAFSLRMGIVLIALKNNCDWAKFIGGIRLFEALYGIPAEYTDRFIKEIGIIAKERNIENFECEEMYDAAFQATENTKDYFYKKAYENRIQNIKSANNELYSFKETTYYATDFFKPQRQGTLEFTPYYVSGYKVSFFHDYAYPSNQKLLSNLSITKQPYYGARLTFNGNLYDKKGKRKPYRREYMSFDYLQSPVTYKPVPDSVFPNFTAFSWKYYSIGYGREYTNQTYDQLKFIVEIGLVTNSFTICKLDNNTKVNKKELFSHFKGLACYVQFGTSIKLAKGIDIFGVFDGTLFNYDKSTNKHDQPAFHSFKFGLNLTLRTGYSYQY